MIAEGAVKANRKAVNQRLLTALKGTETANYDSRPAQSGGLSPPPNKAPTISISGVFIKFSECQAALHTRKAPLLMTFWRRFWTRNL